MRPCLQTTIRRANGEPDPGADVYTYIRGTTTPWPVYNDPTAGSIVTQPLSPDADGNITVWAVSKMQYDLKIDYSDGTSYTRSVDLMAASNDGWTAPTFANGWVNFGSGYENAGYTLDQYNMVHLKGAIKSGTLGNTVFILPAGMQPANARYYTIQSFGSTARCWISSNGALRISGGSNALMILDGIVMPV